MKSESKIQQEIYQWYWNNFCLPSHENREMILHIPNENQHRLMSIGVYAGAADLLVTVLGKVLFVEVKTETGKQSPKQKLFEKHCVNVGIPYYLVRSLEEFKELIKQLLKTFSPL